MKEGLLIEQHFPIEEEKFGDQNALPRHQRVKSLEILNNNTMDAGGRSYIWPDNDPDVSMEVLRPNQVTHTKQLQRNKEFIDVPLQPAKERLAKFLKDNLE